MYVITYEYKGQYTEEFYHTFTIAYARGKELKLEGKRHVRLDGYLVDGPGRPQKVAKKPRAKRLSPARMGQYDPEEHELR